MDRNTAPLTPAADDRILDRAAALLPGAVADLKASNDAARLTFAEVHALERTVRDGIARLQREHFRRVDALELWAILTDLGFEPESHRGHVAVAYHDVEAAFNLAAALTEKYPREAGSILDGCELDKSAGWLWWPRMVTE